MTLLIRGRNTHDWPLIVEIIQSLPAAEVSIDPHYVGTDYFREHLKAPDNKREFAVVAELDGKVVGSAALTRGISRLAHSGEIQHLMVNPAAQRQGVGGALLEAMVALSENMLNLSRVVHFIPVENAHALNLHRKCGFVIEGRLRDGLFRDGRYMDVYILARVRDAF